MSATDKNYLVQAFSQLGNRLLLPDDNLSSLIQNEAFRNPWFTTENVEHAITATGKMLNEADLQQWLHSFDIKDHVPKKVGLILAGNIPLVGFHDILCVLASGNTALIKPSSQDDRLIKYVLQLLFEIAPLLKDRVIYTDRLTGFDAVIATGSNNTSRYFDYYFGKVPNIIRKNRNSVALLTGFEAAEDFAALGHDIFDYFGLGCRNVSALLVPKDYKFDSFFEGIQQFETVAMHSKYNNNYDYNKAIYLVNRDKHLDNGFLLLKEDERIASPLAVVYFRYYETLDDAITILREQEDQIQCVVGKVAGGISNQVVDFGNSQAPRLWDYADGVDTMQFLCSL
ncbi:acyl-CoA reductase [Mucilaginibacter ginkgonis]|uniref:Acyl-CoA reductase n=1 Tax=Mucilaginibacter ginkgonis TaxID=2682091 RepID=A0A6I4HVQ8_9SPHI|nr:acyl-CoA reductase [Mucilaginibacter ginkgonis]QQL51024.1 acyl-CoA reductase [Mucilaginibacter ginkgonis]